MRTARAAGDWRPFLSEMIAESMCRTMVWTRDTRPKKYGMVERYKRLGKNVLLVSSQNQRENHTVHKSRTEENKNQTSLHTMSSPERSLLIHRSVVDSGTPSASVIFLLLRPWAVLSMAKSPSAVRTIMHASVLLQLRLLCIELVLCVVVQCTRGTCHQKAPQVKMFSGTYSLYNNVIHKKIGAHIEKRPEGHPVFRLQESEIKCGRDTARQSHVESIHTQAKDHCKKQCRGRGVCGIIGFV